MTKKISFIGVGNMASAIMRGMTEHGSDEFSYGDLTLFDVDPQKTAFFAERGATVASSIAEAVKKTDVTVLAVKPQQYAAVLGEIRDSALPLDTHLFISLAAGVDTDTIAHALGADAPIVRTMPNTPLLVSRGVTALSKNALVSDADFAFVSRIFSLCGTCFTLDESEMNRIIAVTSSSIAYFYRAIGALCKGASSEGLDGEALRAYAASAAIGAATMMIEQKDVSTDELVRMVTSYKGTTEQMLRVMDENGFDTIVENAMHACTKRADELGCALRESITG